MFLTVMLSLTAFQVYKRKCGKGSLKEDSAAENEETKQTDFSLDNKAFDSDELNGTFAHIKE